MEISDIFIANLDGESKFILKVKEQPSTFGIIEPKHNKEKTKSVFSIKYYWKNIYQGEVFEDTIEEAKEKLKDILTKIVKQNKYVKTFEQFNQDMLL